MTVSTQGAYPRAGMSAHYKDLRELYARRMECHGNGMALMQPISGEDCTPPCCGYFDRNGDWNTIAKVSSEETHDGWKPLRRPAVKSADILIEWQPKTALGVQAITLDASGESPDTLPAGGEGHVQYKSKNKFGAVLMTLKPITLHAYNDERLFLEWLEANKEELYARNGTELKKYGLWLVTRTYNAPGASINAWLDNQKSAIVSVKAKASMLGEAGHEVNLSDSMTDRDWSHYKAKTEHGLVVFLDGIEVPPVDWYLEGLKWGILPRTRSETRQPNTLTRRTTSSGNKENIQPGFAVGPQPLLDTPRRRLLEKPRPSIEKPSIERPLTLVADEDVLQDAGLKGIMNRSGSLRRISYTPSLAPSHGSESRSPSLRRETRSVSRERLD